jgi:hypothetical protein
MSCQDRRAVLRRSLARAMRLRRPYPPRPSSASRKATLLRPRPTRGMDCRTRALSRRRRGARDQAELFQAVENLRGVDLGGIGQRIPLSLRNRRRARSSSATTTRSRSPRSWSSRRPTTTGDRVAGRTTLFAGPRTPPGESDVREEVIDEAAFAALTWRTTRPQSSTSWPRPGALSIRVQPFPCIPAVPRAFKNR